MRPSAFILLGAALALSACTIETASEDDGYVQLVIENRSGAELWSFQYAACGSDDWVEVIGSEYFVADGADVASDPVDPGCYDLYVEDEFACASENDTNGNVAGGNNYYWTLYADDMDCG